jgi:GntR family transcriptional regulator, transcriptional repressor for pyruvate dehydrogenase complex
LTDGSDDAKLSLSRVPRGKLAEAAASRILEGIRSRGLARGARIPSERELMAALGVGRSTVREAINGLAMLGVLEIRHGQGVFVAVHDAGRARPYPISIALSRGVTRDLFEARRLIETEGARLAATRHTDADLRRIAECIDDHERALEGGAPAVDSAVGFHLRIGEAAHNEILSGLVSAFREPLMGRGPVLEALAGYREWELDEHRAVFEPISAGDADEAEARMRAHLDAVVERYDRLGIP